MERNWSASSPAFWVWGELIGVWRLKSQRPMWPPTVVVRTVPGEDGPQVSRTEDQDAIGGFTHGGYLDLALTSIGASDTSDTSVTLRLWPCRRDTPHI